MATPISADIVGDREKFLLYGHPGMGKTFAALTAPDPIYFLSVGAHNEAKTYFSKQFQKKHGKKEIFLDSVSESLGKMGRLEGGPVGFDNACIAIDEALESDEKGEQEFQTIVIDNATVLEEYQMNKVIHIADQARDPGASGFSTYEKFQEHGILTPFDNDWGAAQSLMAKFVSWLYGLDKHIILVAHEHETTVSNRSSHTQTLVAVKPLFVGKQRTEISNKFDNVWRFTAEGQLYAARTCPQKSPYEVIAKTRVGGVIPNDYLDVNLSSAVKKMQKQAQSV